MDYDQEARVAVSQVPALGCLRSPLSLENLECMCFTASKAKLLALISALAHAVFQIISVHFMGYSSKELPRV